MAVWVDSATSANPPASAIDAHRRAMMRRDRPVAANPRFTRPLSPLAGRRRHGNPVLFRSAVNGPLLPEPCASVHSQAVRYKSGGKRSATEAPSSVAGRRVQSLSRCPQDQWLAEADIFPLSPIATLIFWSVP